MNQYKLTSKEMGMATAGKKKPCMICWMKIYRQLHPFETKNVVPDCARCKLTF